MIQRKGFRALAVFVAVMVMAAGFAAFPERAHAADFIASIDLVDDAGNVIEQNVSTFYAGTGRIAVNLSDSTFSKTVHMIEENAKVATNWGDPEDGRVIMDIPEPGKYKFYYYIITSVNNGFSPITFTYINSSLTIQVKAAPFTVTFDSQGGSAVAAIKVDQGAAIGALPVPTRDGYTFDGWFTAASGGTKIDATQVVTADLTLYAQWTKNAEVKDADANSGGDNDNAGLDPVAVAKYAPKKMAVAKAAVGEGTITVKWAAASAAQKVTKYQVRYRAKGTSKWKVVNVSAKKKSVSLKGLKKGKRYEVQLRALRVVKSGADKGTYYGTWSKTKLTAKVK
jgi:uncharacterized repeat protein (TIGR02543 family)